MPLKKGRSKATVRRNIREIHHGPRYKRNVRKFGRKKAGKIAVAAAYNAARR